MTTVKNELYKSKNFPDAFYRVSVRGVVRDGKKFLLGRRHGSDQMWETFGGGLDFGEDLRQALNREVLEETGCKVLAISEQPVLALSHIVHNRRGLEWFFNLSIYFEISIDIERFDFTLQYSEINWFTLDEMQNIYIFEGEEGIKDGFRALIKN